MGQSQTNIFNISITLGVDSEMLNTYEYDTLYLLLIEIFNPKTKP